MQSIAEILSRLETTGTTPVGNDPKYATRIPTLNANGLLDPSFLTGEYLNSIGLTTDTGWLTVGNSPLTSNGTLTLNATTGLAANKILATPDGTTGKVILRGLVAADLPTSVTLQGNTFNGNTQLIQTTSSGLLPGLNGSLITNLNGSSITSGTVSVGRLPAAIAFTNVTQTFTNHNTFTAYTDFTSGVRTDFVLASDSTASVSVGDRVLSDFSEAASLYWGTRALVRSDGQTMLDWSGDGGLGIGGTAQFGVPVYAPGLYTSSILDNTDQQTAIYVDNRQLFDHNSNVSLDWVAGTWTEFLSGSLYNLDLDTGIADVDGQIINWNDRTLNGFAGITVDWLGLQLHDNAGMVVFDWNTNTWTENQTGNQYSIVLGAGRVSDVDGTIIDLSTRTLNSYVGPSVDWGDQRLVDWTNAGSYLNWADPGIGGDSGTSPGFIAKDAGDTVIGGIIFGDGVPISAGDNGLIYINKSGGALTTIYQRRAGAWVGIL